MTSSILLPKHFVFPDFLPTAQASDLLKFVLERPGGFEQATVYAQGTQQVIHQHRHAAKLAGGLGTLRGAFLERMNDALEGVFSGAGVPRRPVSKFETEVVAHGDGGRFSRHIDTLTGKSRTDQTDRGSRAVSAVYYFYKEPKRFTGGELRLYPFGSTDGGHSYVDIIPEQNSLVVFPSFASHEVLLVKSSSNQFEDQRFSVNCWLHCLST
jgi:SM-20-related protein